MNEAYLARIKPILEAGQVNGMPVKFNKETGRLGYDLQAIGESMGMSQDLIDKALSIKPVYNKVNKHAGGWDSDATPSNTYQATKKNIDKLALDRLGEKAIILNNLSFFDPSVVAFDPKDKWHNINIAKAGQFGMAKGPEVFGNFLEKPDSGGWTDVLGKKVLPIAAGLVGAGSLAGVLGAFGSGGSIFGSGAAAAVPEAAGMGGGSIFASEALGGSGMTAAELAGMGGVGSIGTLGAEAAEQAALNTVKGGGAMSGITDWLKENWPGLAFGAGSVVSDFIAGEMAAGRAEDYNEALMNWLTQQQNVEYARQLERQKAAQDWYERVSLPDPEAVAAARRTGMNTLGQGRTNAYESMFNQLAARGFGSGSGLGAGAAGSIEGDYLRSLGTLNDQITQFGLTRQFAPAGQTYGYTPPQTQQVEQYSQPGGWEAAASSMGNVLGPLTGMYAANQMLGKNNKLTWNWGG